MARRYNRRYNARGYSRRSRRSKSGFGGISMPFLIGAALGWTDQDTKLGIPQEAIVGAAVIPVRGLGPIKQAAQGCTFANVVQSFMRKNGNTVSGSGIPVI